MPNIYQWLVFICTVILLFLEISALDFVGVGKDWSGWVDVSVDLFGISPPRLIEYKRGQEEFGARREWNVWLSLFLAPVSFPFRMRLGRVGIKPLTRQRGRPLLEY